MVFYFQLWGIAPGSFPEPVLTTPAGVTEEVAALFLKTY